MSFDVYAAIDVREGRVVRLRQGDYAQETHYADDPLAVAQRYAGCGAQWLHLVDLDAARNGGYTLGKRHDKIIHSSLLASIKSRTSLHVQTGGGVRSVEDVEAILDSGADRVVIGSLAIREPALAIDCLRIFGAERITVALDARQATDGRWMLPSHGWTADSDMELNTLLQHFAENGLRHLLCTDISRDGMLSGPNLDLYGSIVAAAPWLHLQASGGVRDLADVIAVRESGCDGVVLGKALLEGTLDLTEALAC